MYARSNCSVSPATAETAGSFKGIPVAFMGFSRARAKQLQPERFAPLGRARLASVLRATQQPTRGRSARRRCGRGRRACRLCRASFRRTCWSRRSGSRLSLLLRCRNRTRRRGLLLCQLSSRQLHGTTDWDSSNAFALVHPGVRRQRFLCVVAHGLQSFHALFRARLFIIAAARQWTDHREHDHAEQGKKKHNAEPRGQWGARVSNLANRFGVGHIN